MFSWRWGFRTDVRVYKKQDESRALPSKSSGETVKFGDLVDSLKTVDTKAKLWLHPLLFNGVLQTMYYFRTDASDKYHVWYGREVFHCSDGGICSLDWVVDEPESQAEFDQKYQQTLPPGWPKLMPRTRFFDQDELDARHAHDAVSTKPIVVILHGLAGGSHESMIRNLAQLLTTGKNQHKYDVVVQNSRGCCRTKITSGKLYHALSIDDVHEFLTELKARFPNRPIYGVGFSFGALLLTNYLGIRHEANMFKAVATVATPFDLMRGYQGLQKSWSGPYIFEPGLTSFLKKLVKNNRADLQKHDPVLFTDQMFADIAATKTTLEFDNTVTCKTAGFPTAADYYAAGSPARVLEHITTPLLSVSSTDDPTTDGYLPREKFLQNPNIAAVETDLGGHLGFVTSARHFWAVDVVDEFIETFETTVT